MRTKIKQNQKNRGSVLALVVVSLVILLALGTGLLKVAYGVRRQAIMLKNETIARLVAEAGYEKAIFWMSQQPDMLSALQDGVSGTSGSLQFQDGYCNYTIEFYTFAKARPVYKVISVGNSGVFNRTVEVSVIQAGSGWDMGKCRVPRSSTGTYPVNFAGGEIIDMPLQINNLNDSPDNRDIYIIGDPQFLQSVGMGESRYTGGGSDKYASVMDLFDGGIYFEQPDSRITDEASVQSKVDRFENSTAGQFRFAPVGNAPITNAEDAVQLEFFVENGIGRVRITNNSTVRGYRRNADWKTWDFKVTPGSSASTYERYNIYAYHLMPSNADATGERFITDIESTYVTQSINGVESEPGGQIFINGNVIIGSGQLGIPGAIEDTVKGKITIVATGNIWVADSIVVDGAHDADGVPSADNPNILGLIAQGVTKVVDPGMSDYGYVDDTPVEPAGFTYIPIAQPDGGQVHKRHLPDPMVVEAAVTVGGGGWGAENVRRSSYGGRKETSGSQDDLVLRGTIAEVIRGVVGLVGSDGYLKQYYLDERLFEGILPGDIWLRGKYIPSPAGWHDYRQ